MLESAFTTELPEHPCVQLGYSQKQRCQSPSVDGQPEKMRHTHNETWFRSKYERNCDIFRKINGIKDHYLKQNKPYHPPNQVYSQMQKSTSKVYISCYRVI